MCQSVSAADSELRATDLATAQWASMFPKLSGSFDGYRSDIRDSQPESNKDSVNSRNSAGDQSLVHQAGEVVCSLIVRICTNLYEYVRMGSRMLISWSSMKFQNSLPWSFMELQRLQLGLFRLHFDGMSSPCSDRPTSRG